MTIVIGAVPPEEALRALLTRGAAPFDSFSWLDVLAEEHATGFTVAKSAGFDVLADIFEAVERQVAEGRTIREAIKDLRPILQAKGWWGRKDVLDPLTGETVRAQLGSTRRLETIFSTNARVSYAAGHWARFEAQKRIRPYLRYVAILDGRTRPQHALWHNVCLPVDHPWWDTHAPPCGWNCRCTLQSLTERDVERMRPRLKFEPPPETFRSWTNRRTGEVVDLPDGIDPGWAHNPGKVGHQAAALAADKLIDAPPALAAARAQDPTFTAAITPEFEAWATAVAEGRRVYRPSLVAGALEPKTVEAFDQRGEPLASAAILVRQTRIEHALRDAKTARGDAVDPETLTRLPETIKTATALIRDRRDGGVLLYVLPVADPNLRAKVVLRMGRATKHMDGLRMRNTVTANEFVTASIVDVAELRNPGAYEMIWGVI